MKRLALIFLMLQTGFVLAATDKPKDKPNPADFTITVHVVSSGKQTDCVSGLCYVSQLLETVMDGQPVELQGEGIHDQFVGILTLGDYPARISPSIHGPKNPNSYDVYRGYDLLMPDGTARTFSVRRPGPAPSHP